MGSYLNFKNDTSQPESSGNNSNFLLGRQSSIYSFTFDELQSTCGLGKDLGSMNMDDLLKNIEESQALPSSAGGGNLQREGSLTLPRTLSQKTVDEVWKHFQKETVNADDGSGTGGSNFGQGQSTLGEMTLEEFLVRAGAVRDDMQPTGYSNDVTFTQPSNNNIAFQQATQIAGNNIFNVVSTTSSQQKPQQPLFPKQTTVEFASPMQLGNTAQLASPGTRAPISNPSANTTSIMQCGVMSTAVKGGSPVNLDTSSLSPSPYAACGEGGRGRRSCASFEKVVERRRKRMIKNRESAARSRDRKQAYTLELEAEVAKLKEIKHELQKKQAEFIEKQKNQLLENMNMPWENKLICLRRTVTGPW
ncbi:hypothetical protein RND71_039787 [Anisodus tanguticus]|uniref:BZIP domain-containing protein n=1 Tax=Anisodus tanguticus TaxID=243964 RepID=A0AAE1QXH2_9SOLA|nr:hypothetical protein RND71_039787 [Anisodus tanguticus]